MKLICLAFVSFPICVLADGLPSQPYIYVEGRAEIQKPADFVGLHFQVVGHNVERPKANEEVQAKVIKVLALFKEAKVADNDIVAEDLSSQPEYEADDMTRSHSKLIGYTVTRPVGVNIRDIARFSKLV